MENVPKDITSDLEERLLVDLLHGQNRIHCQDFRTNIRIVACIHGRPRKQAETSVLGSLDFQPNLVLILEHQQDLMQSPCTGHAH